jgi:hypothetical protein
MARLKSSLRKFYGRHHELVDHYGMPVLCPVILIRNISEGLFNGARGIVHSLKKDSLPVISING